MQKELADLILSLQDAWSLKDWEMVSQAADDLEAIVQRAS